jgi:hypothetical protein
MLVALVFFALALPCVCGQPALASSFDQFYTLTDLGPVGTLVEYTGMAFSSADTLLLGTDSGSAQARSTQ